MIEVAWVWWTCDRSAFFVDLNNLMELGFCMENDEPMVLVEVTE